ncbi:PspC domain-containing protein [Candidatus Woesearchaeota archaeon]|nr:PspC domain-containing protein [Candidatus Woesearchaeota archaeon]
MVKEIKKLYLSEKDKKIGGVCGGIAEYLGIDSTVVRLIWIVFTLISMGLGLILYLVFWIAMPAKPGAKKEY